MECLITALRSADCPSFLTCKGASADDELFGQLFEALAGTHAGPVRGLRLASCSLDDLQAEQLIRSLIADSQVSVLELPDNSIGVMGAIKIAELVDESSSLTTIDLQGNPCTDAPEVMQRLEALLQRNRTLQRSAKRAAACVTPPLVGASASPSPPCLDTERRLQALEDACSVLRSDLSHLEGCSKRGEAASERMGALLQHADASFGGLDQRVHHLEGWRGAAELAAAGLAEAMAASAARLRQLEEAAAASEEMRQGMERRCRDLEDGMGGLEGRRPPQLPPLAAGPRSHATPSKPGAATADGGGGGAPEGPPLEGSPTYSSPGGGAAGGGAWAGGAPLPYQSPVRWHHNVSVFGEDAADPAPDVDPVRDARDNSPGLRWLGAQQAGSDAAPDVGAAGGGRAADTQLAGLVQRLGEELREERLRRLAVERALGDCRGDMGRLEAMLGQVLAQLAAEAGGAAQQAAATDDNAASSSAGTAASEPKTFAVLSEFWRDVEASALPGAPMAAAAAPSPEAVTPTPALAAATPQPAAVLASEAGDVPAAPAAAPEAAGSPADGRVQPGQEPAELPAAALLRGTTPATPPPRPLGAEDSAFGVSSAPAHGKPGSGASSPGLEQVRATSEGGGSAAQAHAETLLLPAAAPAAVPAAVTQPVLAASPEPRQQELLPVAAPAALEREARPSSRESSPASSATPPTSRQSSDEGAGAWSPGQLAPFLADCSAPAHSQQQRRRSAAEMRPWERLGYEQWRSASSSGGGDWLHSPLPAPQHTKPPPAAGVGAARALRTSNALGTPGRVPAGGSTGAGQRPDQQQQQQDTSRAVPSYATKHHSAAQQAPPSRPSGGASGAAGRAAGPRSPAGVTPSPPPNPRCRSSMGSVWSGGRTPGVLEGGSRASVTPTAGGGSTGKGGTGSTTPRWRF